MQVHARLQEDCTAEKDSLRNHKSASPRSGKLVDSRLNLDCVKRSAISYCTSASDRHPPNILSDQWCNRREHSRCRTDSCQFQKLPTIVAIICAHVAILLVSAMD